MCYVSQSDLVVLFNLLPEIVVLLYRCNQLFTVLLYFKMCRSMCLIADSSIPLLAFPEGATTNGKAGLLKFRSVLYHFCFFSLQSVVIQHFL